MGIRNSTNLWRAMLVRRMRGKRAAALVRFLIRPFRWFFGLPPVRLVHYRLRRSFYRLPLAARYSLFGFALFGLSIIAVGTYADRQYSLNQAEQKLLGKVGI